MAGVGWQRRRRFERGLRGLPLLVAVVVVGAGCGGDASGQRPGATAAEAAFLQAMVPHHESAVEMATLARRRAEHLQVAKLADAIISAQVAEIRSMGRMHKDLFGGRRVPDDRAHSRLGLSAAQAGMTHGSGAAAHLRRQLPFDRAFIDAMIPHHRGAIRMARAVLARGDTTRVRRLAKAIISAQSREIAQMRRWRKTWYAGRSGPAVVDSGHHHR
jgi:uncharacterized protein (DUF305 family)